MKEPIAILLLAFAFAGCTTTESETAYINSADKRLSEPILTTSSEAKLETQREFDESLSSSGSKYKSSPRERSKVTKNARLIKVTRPVYPTGFLAPTEAVVVRVGCVVDKKGRVSEVYVVSTTDSRFDEIALDTVRKWKFEPARSGNRRIPIGVVVPVVFEKSRNSWVPQ